MIFIKRLMVETKTLMQEVRRLEEEGHTDNTYYFDRAKRLELLNLLGQYLKGFTWLRNKDAQSKIKLYINSGGNYRVVYEKFSKDGKPSYNSLQASIIYASKQLETRLGQEKGKENLIDVVLHSDNLLSVEFLVRKAVGAVEVTPLLIADVVDKLPEPLDHTSINLKDCIEELEFLRKSTHTYIQQYISSTLSTEKLSFIRSIIDSNATETQELQFIIYRYLTGAIETTEDLKSILQDYHSIYGV